MAGISIYNFKMTLQDLCMIIKSQWLQWEATDWVVKSLWPLLHIIWTEPQVISVSIQLQWINIILKLQEKSENMFKSLKILTLEEALIQSSLILNNKFNAQNGEAYFKAISWKDKPHTDGNSMLKLLLTIFYQTLPTLYGNGQLQTDFSQEKLCLFSLNTQDGCIWIQTLCQCLKYALNSMDSTKESATFKVMKILKVRKY